MNREPLKVIADIISHEMGITQDRIFIYNDGRELPKDKDLYIVLSIRARPPYGVKTEYKEINGEYFNIQSMNVAENLIVQVVSKDHSARLRCYEVQMAMSSDFAIKQMELHGFHISQISRVFDASFLESTARLNRYDCHINILTAYEKVTPVEYFEVFDSEATFEP